MVISLEDGVWFLMICGLCLHRVASISSIGAEPCEWIWCLIRSKVVFLLGFPSSLIDAEASPLLLLSFG
ncbi:unnamed protein product [Arabidopsis halleri]